MDFFCKDKFEELLDSGFEHTELWESKYITSYSYYVHSIKFRKNNQTSRPPRFDNIFKTSHDKFRKGVYRWIPSPVCISYRINCECMFDDLPFGLATLCAIVMVWTGDHLAQCKMGAVKSGGYSRCRCHYVTSRWCARLAIKVWWNTMTIENIGGIHFPCDV